MTLTVGATLAVTAGTAQALPRRCDAIVDRISYDWDQYNEYMAWAGINAHDGNWQDYVENVNTANFWANAAQADTAAASRSGCF